MSGNNSRKLLGKIIMEGELECLTGLHIGASKENLEIGAVDSPVVRDPLTMEPYIPGSSFKGKLRALLEKTFPELEPNREGGSGIKRHECDDGRTGAYKCPVCRLFGSTGKGKDNSNWPSRIKVRDLPMTDKSVDALAKTDTGGLYTELKFENSIDRVTSAANPRNLERVPRGAKFSVSIVYDVEDTDTLEQDLENLKLSIELLQEDALGGHGSRGYGHVKIRLDPIQARRINFYREKEDSDPARFELNTLDEIVRYFSE